jgi:hypothetical protein
MSNSISYIFCTGNATVDHVTDVCGIVGYSESVTFICIFYHSVQNLPSASLLRTNINMNLCRNTSLPVVLYGCGTWSLTLKEERRGWCVRIGRWVGYFGLRGTTAGEWRKLHNEKFNDIIRLNEMGGACSTYGTRRGTHRDLVVKPEGKRPLGRHWRWQDNIKMDLQDMRMV